MLVYCLTGALALISVCAAQALGPRNHKAATVLWLVTFLALFVPAALRYDIGVDYSATMESAGYLGYWQLYHLYATEPPAAGMDLGFYALIRVLNLFTSNAQWMFAALAALSCGLTLRACRRLSAMPAFSVALFIVAGFYFESLNIARQWVAIACVLNGLEWVAGRPAMLDGQTSCLDGGEDADGRSFVRYALWVAAGSLMHMSCLIWLFVWPLFRLRMSVRRAILLAAGLVMLSFAAEKAAAMVLAGTRFGLYLDPTSSVYVGPQPRLNALITYGITWAFTVVCLCGLVEGGNGKPCGAAHNASASNSSAANGDATCERVAASAASFVSAQTSDAAAANAGASNAPADTADPAGSGGALTLHQRLTATASRYDSALVVIATIAFCLFATTFFLPHIVDRVARYFAPVLVLAMPRCLTRISDLRLRRAAIAVIIVAWLAATYVQVVAGGQYGVVPYQSVFGERAVQGVLS